MTESFRDFSSYLSFLLPVMKVRMIVKPNRIEWGTNRAQYFLHYATPISSEQTLVIYINGDGWNNGLPTDFHFIGQNIALQGYDCIMLGYRKTPKFRFDDIRYDIFCGYKAAVEYIKKQGLKYKKIIVMGSSAGAHLGALLCLDTHSQRKYDVQNPNISGFVSIAGPLCFGMQQTSVLNRHIRDLFYGTKNRSEGEPIMKLEEGQKIPILAIQSRYDGVVGFEQAQAFCSKAQKLGLNAELYEITDRKITHNVYSLGIFLKERGESVILDKIYTWIDALA